MFMCNNVPESPMTPLTLCSYTLSSLAPAGQTSPHFTTSRVHLILSIPTTSVLFQALPPPLRLYSRPFALDMTLGLSPPYPPYMPVRLMVS